VVFAPAAALAVSALMLTACGRTPTGPASVTQGLPAAVASERATFEPDRPTATAGVMTVAATTHEDGDDAAALAAREEELAAREQQLREEREELRRERERLAAQAGRAQGSSASNGESDAYYDADQGAPSTTSASGSSSIQKVATPPIMVPSGTPMQVELTANVNTKVARVGDKVEGRLAEDLVVDDRRAAIAGAVVSGSVTELVSGSDKMGGTPTIGLTFESLQAANGATVPIVARYRQQGDSDTAADAAKVIGGAAAGAVVGHQVGEDDKGTVIGGILGGAAGAAAAQKTGGEVKLHAGTVITVPTEMSFSIY
jgi:hypothetical protein